MNDDAMDSLAKGVAETAMSAAVAYFRSAGVQLTKDNIPEFVALLKQHVRRRLTQALDDARKALDAGMGDAATLTFTASMVLAGTDAAKEWLDRPAS